MAGIGCVEESRLANGSKIVARSCSLSVVFFVAVKIVAHLRVVHEIICEPRQTIGASCAIAFPLLLANVVSSVLCFGTDHRLTAAIDALQRRYNERDRRPSSLRNRDSFVRIALCILLCVAASTHYPLDRWSMRAIFFYYRATLASVIAELAFFVVEIRRQLRQLRTQIKRDMFDDSPPATYFRIEALRSRYEELVSTVEYTESSLGRRFLIAVVALPAESLLRFYAFVFHRDVPSFVWFVPTFSLFLAAIQLVATVSSDLFLESYECYQILNCVPITKWPLHAQFTMLLSIATYSVVILQVHVTND